LQFWRFFWYNVQAAIFFLNCIYIKPMQNSTGICILWLRLPFKSFVTEVCILSYCSLRPPSQWYNYHIYFQSIKVSWTCTRNTHHSLSGNPNIRILDDWLTESYCLQGESFSRCNYRKPSVDHDPKTNIMKSSSYCDVLTIHAICHNCSNFFLFLFFFFFFFLLQR